MSIIATVELATADVYGAWADAWPTGSTMYGWGSLRAADELSDVVAVAAGQPDGQRDARASRRRAARPALVVDEPLADRVALAAFGLAGSGSTGSHRPSRTIHVARDPLVNVAQLG